MLADWGILGCGRVGWGSVEGRGREAVVGDDLCGMMIGMGRVPFLAILAT